MINNNKNNNNKILKEKSIFINDEKQRNKDEQTIVNCLLSPPAKYCFKNSFKLSS